MIRRIRRKRINEWTEHDLDQYVDLWFDNFASSTDFETMDRIALGRVPVRVLQDCLDSLANDYGIGEYKVNLYSDDIRNRIVELAEEDLEKWEEYEDDYLDESVNRRRNVKSFRESVRDDYPMIKDIAERLHLSIKDTEAINRILNILELYVPKLKSNNKEDAEYALREILNEAEEMIRLKKQIKKKDLFGIW